MQQQKANELAQDIELELAEMNLLQAAVTNTLRRLEATAAKADALLGRLGR